MSASDVLHCFSPFKSSLHLLFFLLAPRSECLRVSLACLRDDRLTVFVTLALTNRALALSRNRLISGYDIGPMFERSNNPTQSLKERPQFIWSGKRYRTNIFRSSTVGNLANNQPAILRIRTKNDCSVMATDLDFVSFCQFSYHAVPLMKKAEKVAFDPLGTEFRAYLSPTSFPKIFTGLCRQSPGPSSRDSCFVRARMRSGGPFRKASH
jgi:hypothetical protein